MAAARTPMTAGEGGLRLIATLADVPQEPASQDPLGFGPSAERLADVFAPGLTVGTRSVRYFQLLTAASWLAAETGAAEPRAVTLRLERIWALASYLADPDVGDATGSGLAGIRAVRRAAKPGNQSQKADYQMFRGDGQARLGVWGLYRSSAEHLLLINALNDPTPLGERLAAPFVQHLDKHRLRSSALGKSKTASTASLIGCGSLVGLFAPLDRQTAEAAWEAVRSNPDRRVAANTIATKPKATQEDLLAALERLPRFSTAAAAARALETTFAALTRLFDAALKLAGPAVVPEEVRASPALTGTLTVWKDDAARCCEQMEPGHVDGEVVDLARRVANATDPWEAVLLLLERHVRVQEAKRRQPWLSWHAGHLVRSAAVPIRGYDPFDSSAEPRGHDMRLLNLRAVAREIRDAGVSLT
jgi:hypothetical protein